METYTSIDFSIVKSRQVQEVQLAELEGGEWEQQEHGLCLAVRVGLLGRLGELASQEHGQACILPPTAPIGLAESARRCSL